VGLCQLLLELVAQPLQLREIGCRCGANGHR
jgi:hypothetical protein